MSVFEKTPPPEIKHYEAEAIPGNFADNDGAGLVELAADLLRDGLATWALIHLDDGVLWGRLENGKVVRPAASEWLPELRTQTIQQCRVFNEKGELFVWRENEDSWIGRQVTDTATREQDVIDENQILYGDKAFPLKNGFTSVLQSGVGLRHVVPVVVTPDDFSRGRRLNLTVRHYFGEDDDGQTRIVCSRLKTIQLT